MKNEEYFREMFASEPPAGQDKIVSLREALEKNLKAGMSVFLGWNANAAVCEIMRRYRGEKPGFTLVMSVTWNLSLNLVHCGLVKKIISGGCSYTAPNPGPSHVIQRAWREKKVQIENWTLYSMQQRLMAGALGVGFMPTRSIAGSSMAAENKGCFIEIADPFNSSRKIGAVKALNTDIAIVHALAADRYGNTIMSPVSQDTLWGPRASKGGVIVTTEKIVDHDFIRRHSYLVGIPGYLVKSVSLCPIGAHPEGLFSCIEGVDSYGEDYEFMLEQRKVSREPVLLDAWLKRWIYDVGDQEEYTNRLGSERILALKSKLNATNHKGGLSPAVSESDASRTEVMIIAASGVIAERVKESGYQVLLAGIGAPGLAAWLAYYRLRKEGIGVKLILGSGVLGYQPSPGDSNLLSVYHVPSADMLIDTSEMYGFIISGEGAKCLSVIGAAQIDERGNINTTRVGADTYISGSGGNNDNTSGAAEVIVVTAQSKRRCVEQLDYLTSPGDRVSTLVTDRGVFSKDADGRFVLTSCISGIDSKCPVAKQDEIQDNCGWKIKAAAEVTLLDFPDEQELALLRLLDPHGYVSGG
ncbi:MAG: citrate lyase subunit alpha [Dehalococcoidia bacterium]|nr:citrate lyase subunit alpha [Dehalococcoidia bacterium]